MAGPVKRSLVSFSFHDYCFDDSAVDLANHHLAEQTLGQVHDFLPKILAIEFILVFDIFGCEVAELENSLLYFFLAFGLIFCSLLLVEALRPISFHSIIMILNNIDIIWAFGANFIIGGSKNLVQTLIIALLIFISEGGLVMTAD